MTLIAAGIFAVLLVLLSIGDRLAGISRRMPFFKILGGMAAGFGLIVLAARFVL